MRRPEDRFIDKIQEIFENYQDDSADLGWKQLEKLRKNDQPAKPLFLWLSSVAAILLIALGVWFSNSRIEKSTVIAKKNYSLKKQPITNPTAKNPIQNEPLQTGYIKDKNIPQEQSADIYKKKSVITKTRKSIENRNSVYINSGNVNSANDQLIVSSYKDSDTKDQIDISKNSTSLNSVIAVPTQKTLDTASFHKEVPLLPANASLEDMKSGERLSTIKPNDKINTERKSKTVALSVYAGTHFNYSKGSENSLNLGVGISSDIKLTKNLKLSTGIAIAQNTLKYSSNSNLPASATAGFSTALNNSHKGIYDASPLLSNGLGALIASKINDFNANLLSLDIPVNLKYQVLSKKNKLYLLAGLSSGTYLSEVYTYKYNQSSVAGSQVIFDRQGVEITNKGSNNFYLAKTLNVSAGFSTRLTKTQDLTIEPFIKYPLGGQGEQNIKFGAAGINLKLNFNSSLKK